MRRFSISLFLYLAIFIISCENALHNSFKLRNVICNPVEEFITNTACTIKAIGRDKFLLNMDGDVVKPIKNLTITANVYKFFNGYRFLQGLTLNACDILSRKKFHPLTNLVLTFGPKFSNLIHPCPFSGHIFARNLSYIPGIIESLVPSGRYKGKAYLFEGYPLVSIGTVEGYADIEELYTNH